MRINLGVVDLPYSHTANLGATRRGKHKGRARASTTGDVADILEAKYGVMGAFVDRHSSEIEDALAESVRGHLESLLMGGPVTGDVYDLTIAAGSEIEVMFQKFLDAKEMDGLVNGVPTQASLDGISHRFKTKRGPARPSFIDTGLYQSSFRCWGE